MCHVAGRVGRQIGGVHLDSGFQTGEYGCPCGECHSSEVKGLAAVLAAAAAAAAVVVVLPRRLQLLLFSGAAVVVVVGVVGQ